MASTAKSKKSFFLDPRSTFLLRQGPSSLFLGAVLVGLALISAFITFRVLTGLTALEPEGGVITAALVVNGLICLGLLLLIGWEIWPLWRAKRAGHAAARLHGRIVALFCGVAAVPAIIVAIVASYTLDVGLDRWFSTRTRAIVDNALTVSRAYLQDHTQMLRYDISAMAQDINRAAQQLADISALDPVRFQSYLTQQAVMRALPVVYVLRSDGSILLQSSVKKTRNYNIPAPSSLVAAAQSSEPLILTPDSSDQVGAVIKLQAFDDTYLYVARPADPNRLRYLQEAEDASNEYKTMDLRRSGVQVAFGLTYAGVAIILLLAAVWCGLAFANRLVAPIRRLISAADKISHGQLDVQVPVKPEEGDLAHLCQTFNTMTQELKSQRNTLLDANTQINARRLFTEAVLSGVTAGVIGLNPRMQVKLINKTALDVLGDGEERVIGQPLQNFIPEIAGLLEDAHNNKRFVQGEIVVKREGGERNFFVRVTSEQDSEEDHGYVVTLDDITDLVTAQRSSAWADVARRIAHEIKNPLTPIQLSAERLRRKYEKKLPELDRDVFDQCIDTIIRQVNDIGRMVDEFSSFARMPAAQIQDEDIGDLVRQVVFLMRIGNPQIEFTFVPPAQHIRAACDRRLISQSVTNLVKNAVEAIGACQDNAQLQGHVIVRVYIDADAQVVIEIEDNGIGLPPENRQRLLEPYMTTRAKGTGLGLAIVNKVIEDHGGSIALLDRPDAPALRKGAVVRLAFPYKQTLRMS